MIVYERLDGTKFGQLNSEATEWKFLECEIYDQI